PTKPAAPEIVAEHRYGCGAWSPLLSGPETAAESDARPRQAEEVGTHHLAVDPLRAPVALAQHTYVLRRTKGGKRPGVLEIQVLRIRERESRRTVAGLRSEPGHQEDLCRL